MTKTPRTLALIVAILAAAPLIAIESGTRYESTVDWRNGNIRIDVEQDAGSLAGATPKMRFELEKRIEQMMPGAFFDALTRINLDSLSTVAEAVSERNVRLDALRSLSESGEMVSSFITLDFKRIRLRFEYPLFGERGLVSCFVFHKVPVPVEHALGVTDAGRFTGLVVYAKGTYELYAKKTEGKPERALFPALYDDEMNLLVSKEMCEPAFLEKWGLVLYTDSTDEKQFTERIGVAPLRTIAVALFGKHNADILIPGEDAMKLLASSESRKILSEGRILVITD
jgi:hypothetical protein